MFNSMKVGQLLVRVFLFVSIVHGLFTSDYWQAVIGVAGLAAAVWVSYRRAQVNQGSTSQLRVLWEASDFVGGRAGSVIDSTERLKEIATVQNANAHSASEALKSVTEIIEKTAAHAESLGAASSQTSAAAHEGHAVVGGLRDGMGRVHSSVSELSHSIDENTRFLEHIVALMHEIQSKSSLIKDVVFKTRLLSFNASVEAARAGEHGRGFSVVAEEMGELARNSSVAAGEIDKIVESSIQESTAIIGKLRSELIEMMNRAQAEVQRGGEAMEKSREFFERIKNEAERISEMSDEIRRSAEMQKQGIADIGKGIQEIERKADQLQSESSSIHENVTELGSWSERLETPVERLSSLLGMKVHKEAS